MWENLGLSGGSGFIFFVTLYFVIKWAVKSGIKEAYRDISSNMLPKEKIWKPTTKNSDKEELEEEL